MLPSKPRWRFKSRPKISLVVAVDQKGVIGQNGGLPWPKIKKDLAHFYHLTKGKPVVMGRKTFDSLGKPLPERENIVLTRTKKTIPGCLVVHSLSDLFEKLKNREEVMIIGGASIYRQFLPLADTMYLTVIQASFEGDKKFPFCSSQNWEEKERVDFAPDEENDFAFSFQTLKRKYV